MHMKFCNVAFINQNQSHLNEYLHSGILPWHKTDPMMYGIGRLTNDVLVNITVYSEVKFYQVNVKLALTISCTCIVVLCT
jgi:hypothetical protein